MGLSCSDDEYNRRADMALVDQVNTVRVLNDLLRFDRDFPANVKGVCALLQAVRKAGITLNFRGSQVGAAGFPYSRQLLSVPGDVPTGGRFPKNELGYALLQKHDAQ
jgi:hypothetical protein